ncbi:protein-L-isoaspartate O-methyltransferase [Candidatus Parcubacteria bacterium]|nr:protein-L-isoaspartate O-methyltransferase [Candidatus Parcubacteria bacterium]
MLFLYAIFAIILTFGMVVFFGAPYLPTLANTKKNALDLLELKPGQTLLELGSGDGRVMVSAAQRGLYVVGYELNPLLVLISIYQTRKYRSQVKIIWGNFWTKNWPECDAIYIFLLDRYMNKLDKKIRTRYKKPILVVSNSFKITAKKHIKELHGVYLYKY